MSLKLTSELDGLVLLHLSDMHFGNKNRFQNKNMEDFGRHFGIAVRNACVENNWSRSVDIIIVSGDLAEVGKPKEFLEARTFLSSVARELGLEANRTVFAPGNHDFSWALCKKVDADREIEDFSEEEYNGRINKVKFKFFQEFLRDYYSWTEFRMEQLPGYVSLHEPSGAYLRDAVIDGALPVTIGVLNSCETETHVRYGGEVSREQAESLLKTWSASQYDRYLKIVVVHHNPFATPSQNLRWTQEWFEKQIEQRHLNVTADWLRQYTADMAGFRGADYLQKIVYDTGVHLVLHGHHHNPSTPNLWANGPDSVAPILSVGSLGLDQVDLPPGQPLTCQLLYFKRTKRPILTAVPLEFDPNLQLKGSLDDGHFRLNLKSKSVYSRQFKLPTGWTIKKTSNKKHVTNSIEPSIEVARFVNEYRSRTVALYSSYDLKNLGVLPEQMDDTQGAQLDDLYLPLRFDASFNLNKTQAGKVFDINVLYNLMSEKRRKDRDSNDESDGGIVGSKNRVRRQALSIIGAAGTGKTTWMRYTFRRMREDKRLLPFFVELRAWAKFCGERPDARDEHTIEAYLIYWLKEQVPGFRDSGVSLTQLFEAPDNWMPVLLVDGWDELGDIGNAFREKLLGLLSQYPRLLAITSSRPYGSGRPTYSDGFVLMQVQPLDFREISDFALNFYHKCYGEELTLAVKQAADFENALRRSDDARLLAKTPLLLTMMLFINRSKRLPDKRHELYEECLMSLLSERPEMQMDEGARLSLGEWCPPETGASRMQIVAQMAYQIQSNHSSVAENAAAVIVVPRDIIVKYLPPNWTPREKRGFLLWLCNRAGVMVDDVQDNLYFAHLSFQEFLTAWHLNNNEVKDDASKVFLRLADSSVWWETLLLWAALLNNQSRTRAEDLLQTLYENDQIVLSSMMLADGVGSASQAVIVTTKLGVLFYSDWPNEMTRCIRAWQASRQLSRRKEMAEAMSGQAAEYDWFSWFRVSKFLEEIGEKVKLPAGNLNSAKRAPLTAFLDNQTVSKSSGQFAGMCAINGITALWPGYPEGLLKLWPAQRVYVSQFLKLKVSLGASKSELVDWIKNYYLTGGAEPKSKEFYKDVVSARGFFSAFNRTGVNDEIARGFARELNAYIKYPVNVDEDVVRFNRVSQTPRRMSRKPKNVSEHLFIASNLALASDFAASCDLVRMQIRKGRLSGAYVTDEFVMECVNDLSVDKLTRRIRGLASSAEIPGLLLDLALVGTAVLRSAIASLTFIKLNDVGEYYIPIGLICPAVRVNISKGRLGLDYLHCNLHEVEKRGEEGFWSAFARHIAGMSSEFDVKLLLASAKNLDLEDENLARGLKYIVRGDIRLLDGDEVTLDELCLTAGVPVMPILEDAGSFEGLSVNFGNWNS